MQLEEEFAGCLGNNLEINKWLSVACMQNHCNSINVNLCCGLIFICTQKTLNVIREVKFRNFHRKLSSKIKDEDIKEQNDLSQLWQLTQSQ